ncbi:hypothetical protein KSP40_PGU010352 [Platanthera guangdongensis]|uniref:Reverse transcriptase Ty1/copia-type domain-containing protein n=1 Tax=Platanthera guangdongensis TaxID=2320717 RepID=A0ABR2MS83_9ASPA
MFIRRHEQRVVILIVYVDDIVITGNDTEEIVNLKTLLYAEFEVKDLRRLRYFLGIEVVRSEQGIFISQRKYILDLLKETNMLGCVPANTLIEENRRIDEYDDGDHKDVSLCILSRYVHSPRVRHQEVVYRLLRYLKKAPGRGLLFSRNNNLKIEVFIDVDWAECRDDKKSTTEYCSFVGGNLVTWRRKKQNVVARSSAQAEYRVMSHGLCEELWLCTVLQDIGFPMTTLLSLFCHNKITINISHNHVQHDRTKHVEAILLLLDAFHSFKDSESIFSSNGVSQLGLATFHSAAEIFEILVSDSTSSSLRAWIGHAMEFHKALHLASPGSHRKDAPARLLEWIDAGVVYQKNGAIGLLRYAAVLASGGDAHLSSTTVLVSDSIDVENVVEGTSDTSDSQVLDILLGKLVNDKFFDGITLRNTSIVQLTTAIRIFSFISDNPVQFLFSTVMFEENVIL